MKNKIDYFKENNHISNEKFLSKITFDFQHAHVPKIKIIDYH